MVKHSPKILASEGKATTTTPMTGGYKFAAPVEKLTTMTVTAQGSRSTMAWAGFTYDYKTVLEVIKGNMTATKYRYEILHDFILPFQQAHEPRTSSLCRMATPQAITPESSQPTNRPTSSLKTVPHALQTI